MTNSYDNQTLFSYLLGSLPEADTERLDEMTFTDPDFADLVNAAEKDLVDAYVNGELTGATMKNFDSHYMASPKRREKVIFARAFKEFAANERTDENPSQAALPEIKGVKSKGKIGTFFESLGILGGWRPFFGFAAVAAVLALALFGGWIFIRGVMQRQAGNDVALTTNQNNAINAIIAATTPIPTATPVPINGNGSSVRPSPTPEPSATPKRPPVEPSQPVIATFVLPPPLRGGAPLTQVQLAPQIQAAQFTLGLESGDYASYKVELHDASEGGSVWQASSVKARGSSLGVRIPAKLLRARIYSFTVSGLKADGTEEPVGDYAFRVVR